MTSIAEDEPADDADDDAEADDDLSGSDDLEGSDEDDEDDEEDDEWHTHAPVGDDPDDDLDQVRECAAWSTTRSSRPISPISPQLVTSLSSPRLVMSSVGPTLGAQEIFRGFTFRRERSFVSSSSFSLGGLTAGSFASPKKR